MDLIYQTTPTVIFATNTFINVPTVLQFDDTPLISVVKEENLGFTREIPIYHAEGTYLAKVRGTLAKRRPTKGALRSWHRVLSVRLLRRRGSWQSSTVQHAR